MEILSRYVEGPVTVDNDVNWAARADPREIVLGGAWGPALRPEITAAVSATPRPVPLRPAGLTGEPPLIGARHNAVDRLRALITESA